MKEYRRLWRTREDAVVAGICGGLGRYFNIDPVILRIIWVLFALTAGSGIIAYLICWLVIPREPDIVPGGQTHEFSQ